MRSIGLKLILLFLFHFSNAQISSYWVYLDNEGYWTSVRDALAQDDHVVIGYSHWLNAIAIRGEDTLVNSLCDLTGISRVTKQGYIFRHQNSYVTPMNGFALEQLGVDALIAQGLDGSGVTIGIIDGGFLGAPAHPSLIGIFDDGRVKGYRDFITPGLPAYGGSKAHDDKHGTDVMQLVGGVDKHTNIRHGLANGATYYLARTDHGANESRLEEYYLIKALEWMDSLGVKLVNISLGYTSGYDLPEENYKPEQMDGSSAVAQAVQKASVEKGMLVVVSAGNDGDKEWRVISTPADARHALSVGATKYNHWDKATFSSVGPSHISYLKPDVACFAAEGTSFSAPIITGLAALIWQKDSSLSNLDVRKLIIEAGHLYPYGNNYVGYGVPLVENIQALMDGVIPKRAKELKIYGNTYKLPERAEKHVVLYHKRNPTQVVKEEYVVAENHKIRIIRPANTQFTTVVVDNEAMYEIRWMSVN